MTIKTYLKIFRDDEGIMPTINPDVFLVQLMVKGLTSSEAQKIKSALLDVIEPDFIERTLFNEKRR